MSQHTVGGKELAARQMYSDFLKLVQEHKGNKNKTFLVLELSVMKKQSIYLENFLVIQR